MAPFISFLFIAGGLLIFSILMFRSAFKIIAKKRDLNKTQTTLIRNIDNGFYEISGIVSSESTQISSLASRKECVGFSIEVFEFYNSGNRANSVSVFKTVKSGVCILEDESGSCIVDLDPERTELSLIFDKVTQPSEVTDDIRTALMNVDDDLAKRLQQKKRFQYKEELLSVGDDLHVIGNITVSDEEKHRSIIRDPSSHPAKLSVSNQSEEALVKTLQKRIVLQLLIAGFFLGLVIWFSVLFFTGATA